MTESEFQTLAEGVLSAIEAGLERATNADTIDVECSRNGNVLEIELIDAGSKIIVNSQAAMQEIWLAARSGGFHYRYDGTAWVDTRSGQELFDALSNAISEQAGVQLTLTSSVS